MKKFLLAATALAASVSLSFAAVTNNTEARLLRFPATNGNKVVFSYGGDLYTASINGGEAVRLTSHIGYEAFAKFSPDGKYIAFTGEYDGNREVYLMPEEGGEPVRLTYTSTNSRDDMGDRMGPNNIVMGWTPDGKYIVYRNRIGSSFTGKLQMISKDGGMPVDIPLPEGGFCSWSPDGKKLAYNRVMREFRTWKYYRGGMADEVWIYDSNAKKVEKITDNIAQDLFPMWVGDEIFFASDRDMTMNLFVYNLKTKETSKVTDYSDYDIKFPSTNGKLIVYEKGGYIFKFDPASRKSEQIHITLNSDNLYARPERRNVSNRISSYSLSPDGERIAVVARGEVFNVPAKSGVTYNLSKSAGANERGAQWSPDGKYIAWIGDGTGESEVYLYDVAKGGAAAQITKGSDSYIQSIRWSPDSKKILYTDRKNRLVELDPVTKIKRVIMQRPEGGVGSLTYSPDSKWLAYTKSAENDMRIVYLYNIAENKEYPVTEKWYNSGSPKFSTDGKYLIITADRDLSPIYSRVEWNYAYSNMSKTYIVMLSKETPSPFIPAETLKELGYTAAAASKAENNEVVVKVDPKGIEERIVKVPISAAVRNAHCDGKKLWYSSANGTMVYDFATGKEEKCSDGSINYRYPDKKALFSKRNELYVAPVSAKVALSDAVSMKDLYTTVDFSQEWPQIFDEVWRAYRDGFYLENMHGLDWKAIKEKYAVLLPYVKTRLDLNYVLGEMISEVACGHAYVNPGEYAKPARISMGLLGAKIERDKSGFFKISHILKGAPYRSELRSPLTEPGLGIVEGDYITAIDGTPVTTVDNIYKLLVGKAGVSTELTINKKAAEGGKKIIVKPVADESMLYHYEWVLNNIRTVEEKSGGKVGYIYIPDMNVEGINEFVRYYYPQLDKEALIIDDRANGGGNVSPMIIERLQREVYRMTMSRNSTRTSTIPEGTHTGPKVLLINKYSASDGDLFPWSFKANNLGTVVGTRTWGGIVGISGSLPYMDATDVRVPFFTNYDAKTGKWIVENHGVDPDILIENDPIKEEAGIDEQLNEAIRVAMEQLKERKPLPGVPAPRTYKDLGLPEKSK